MKSLVWVDLETTGLDPSTGRILEIALLVTDADLRVLHSYQSLVGPAVPQEEIRLMHPLVQSMHLNNGLFADLIEAEELLAEQGATAHLPNIHEVDGDTSWWLGEVCPDERGEMMLAGSTVSFDRSWMKIHMPKTEAMFHYRNADISAMREFMSRWVPGHDELVERGLVVKKKHRAADDIEDSLNLAAFYRGLITRTVREAT